MTTWKTDLTSRFRGDLRCPKLWFQSKIHVKKKLRIWGYSSRLVSALSVLALQNTHQICMFSLFVCFVFLGFFFPGVLVYSRSPKAAKGMILWIGYSKLNIENKCECEWLFVIMCYHAIDYKLSWVSSLNDSWNENNRYTRGFQSVGRAPRWLNAIAGAGTDEINKT